MAEGRVDCSQVSAGLEQPPHIYSQSITLSTSYVFVMSGEGSSSGSRRNTVIRPGESGPGDQDDLYSTSPRQAKGPEDKPRTRMAEAILSTTSL